MEDFLGRHSEFYRTLAEFPEGTSVTEVLEQAGCTAEQLFVLMELEQQKEDIFEYVFGSGALFGLTGSLKDQDISELLRVAEFLCLSPEIIRKLKIQLGTPETLKMLVPEGSTVNFALPEFWIALDCVGGLKNIFTPYDNDTCCVTAAEYGSLECLKWAHEHGCPWHPLNCTIAAENGQLECLKWAHENGCPWDGSTCSYAADNGHLECLKWAHENGCPWNEPTCSYAAENGHLECLQYAHQHGCPWDKEDCLACAKTEEIKEWIKNQPDS